MQLVRIDKDKQGRAIALVDISLDEIADIKKAVELHPKFKDPEPEGMRFRALAQKTDDELRKPTNIMIKDMKEAINRYNQEIGSTTETTQLYNDLHEIWKAMNPS
jgi:hypothetical protein